MGGESTWVKIVETNKEPEGGLQEAPFHGTDRRKSPRAFWSRSPGGCRVVDGDRLSQFCPTILSKLWRGGEPEGVFRRGRGWSDVELLRPPAQDFPQRELDLPVQQREPHLDCPDHPLLAGKHLPHNVSSGGK